MQFEERFHTQSSKQPQLNKASLLEIMFIPVIYLCIERVVFKTFH